MKSKRRANRFNRNWIIKGFIIALLVILLNLVFDQDISVSAIRFYLSPHPQALNAADGPDTFIVQLQPPWGQIYVDGHLLQQPALNGDLFPLQFSAGQHTLRWQSEQFQTQQCTFFVPVHPATDKAQTCNIQNQGTAPGAAPRYGLSFPILPSLSTVQKSLQQPLLQAIQHYLNTLDATTTVQPGEPYRYNSQTPTYTAHQPLTARQSFLLDTNIHAPANCTGPYLGSVCTYAETGADCRLICSIDWINSRTMDQNASWTVGVVTRPMWSYRSAAQASDAKSTQPLYQGDQQFTTLRITWEHQAWHVSAHSEGVSGFDDPNCIHAIGEITSNAGQGDNLSGSGTTAHITDWSFISGQNRAQGCLVKAQVQSASVRGQKVTTSNVYFLYRFGILTATDETARTLDSRWPLSRADVKRIVPEILAKPAFTT